MSEIYEDGKLKALPHRFLFAYIARLRDGGIIVSSTVISHAHAEIAESSLSDIRHIAWADAEAQHGHIVHLEILSFSKFQDKDDAEVTT